jgi:ribonuclease BN (tRNA processing enzyme)
MRIKILGCSGGVGAGLRTTSILIDDDILIDAGTGVGDLPLADLRQIRHVFLTHAHLDHVAGLPLFIDAAFDSLVAHPLEIHARAETIAALRAHMFNGVVWPDFSELPTPASPVLRFHPIDLGARLEVAGRVFRAVDVAHSVPSVGYCVEFGDGLFAFSGDTMSNHTLWPVLNEYPKIDVFIVEVSFPNRLQALARTAGHYCPRSLAVDIAKLEHDPDIWITGMKPGDEDLIMSETMQALPSRRIRRLTGGQVFEL